MPHGIKTKGVDRLGGAVRSGLDGNGTLLDLPVVLTVKDPARAKEVETKGEHIVVNETGVNGEETHHGNHIPTGVHTSCHLAKLGLVVGLLVPKEVEAGAQEEETVTDITVHDTEEEGEGGGCEEGGVGLSITGNTVRVHELLVTVGELVGGEMGGRSRPGLGDLVNVRGHVGVHAGMRTSDGVTELGGRFGDHPTLATEHAGNVRLEHVERVVDGLLADDDPCPALGVTGEHLAKTETSVLILEKDGARVD
mmetsp:Transcript_11891/g.24589  ORF Transcript_11891/g.24589 Transcript_11891/m.24589 type:complete len:252 (-) Transcript_11891:373-1128(-)